ncbi:MAG TPA: hypothetical protein VJZ68_05670 [Nitrososphaera sp.]|nr:hypothetical protein [Nitrososphaera sp.]
MLVQIVCSPRFLLGSASESNPVIVIPYDSESNAYESKFIPDQLRIVIGVNDTVTWRNDDSVFHRLIGEQLYVSAKPVDFGKSVILYPEDSISVTFQETGLYGYRDQDKSWMYGLIEVLPHEALNAQLDISINGLKDSYTLGEPVEFTVDAKGYETGCGSFEVELEKISNTTTSGMLGDTSNQPFRKLWAAVFDCLADPPFRDIDEHLPYPSGHDTAQTLTETPEENGKYRVTATFATSITTYSEVKEFVVRAISPTNPVMKNAEGLILNATTQGQPVEVSITVYNTLGHTQPFVAILEARDDGGVTEFLGFTTGRLEDDGLRDIRMSWTPQKASDYYLLRTFLITGFEEPEILSEIKLNGVVVE